jgi:hypothetical protein
MTRVGDTPERSHLGLVHALVKSARGSPSCQLCRQEYIVERPQLEANG